ncbi:Oidioi.mRNA.OKI2018_I69.chr2.g4143.t1.cds [Oikopleura dioica]|uniref:Oidioi.mRNA.OKI2018_I69.chr2.g4143.t1.cds n=1 Tax=Oikopleura dioica TaxID=34765 RepID=A0ABN7T1W7_OIKDI|nr:Oidioi.mRNA.OKI2018_I69.chr2.g4143.t1.cds [Oikopleura dioica]
MLDKPIFEGSRGDLIELRSLCKPPGIVNEVLRALVILLGFKPTPDNISHLLSNVNDLQAKMATYNLETVLRRTRKLKGVDIDPDKVCKASKAASSVAKWVKDLQNYQKSPIESFERSRSCVDFSLVQPEEIEEEKRRSKVRVQKKQKITRPRISKAAILELKSFKCPPDTVQRIAGAAAVMIDLPSEWTHCRKMLDIPDLAEQFDHAERYHRKRPICAGKLWQLNRLKITHIKIDEVLKVSQGARQIYNWLNFMLDRHVRRFPEVSFAK